MDFESDQWTFFKPRPEPTSSASTASTSTRSSRTARSRPDRRAARGRADDDGRARRLVPARHGRDELPDGAREDRRDRRGDRPRRGALPLLPQRVALRARAARTSAASFRLGRPGPGDVLPPYTELVRFDAGPRLAGAELRGRRARPAARPPRPRAGRATRSTGSASGWRPTAVAPRRATTPTTTPTRSRPSGWPARASSSLASHVDGCSATRARRRRGDGPHRRGLQGPRRSSSPGGGRSIPSRCVPRHGDRLGRGHGRARRAPSPDAHAASRRSSAAARRWATTCARSTMAGRRRPRAGGPHERRATRRPRAGSRARCPARPRGRSRRRRARTGPATSTAEDWWFRTSFDAAAGRDRRGGRPALRRHRDARRGLPERASRSLATANRCSSRTTVDVGATAWAVDNELVDPVPGARPAARASRASRGRAGGPRLVADGNLRWFRTMLLGRAPGFAPGPPAVGPWRPVAARAAERHRRRGPARPGPARRRRRPARRSVRASARSMDGRPTRPSVELDGPSGPTRPRSTILRPTARSRSRAS